MMECWNNGILGLRPSGRYTPAAGESKPTANLFLFAGGKNKQQ